MNPLELVRRLNEAIQKLADGYTIIETAIEDHDTRITRLEELIAAHE